MAINIFLLVWFLLIQTIANQQSSSSCDSCEFSCCDVYANCATQASFCYCRTSTCTYKCCVDERCGTESECSTSSTLAVIIVLISIFGICVICFTLCVCLSRFKKKNMVRNRVRNDDHSNDNDVIEVIQLEGGPATFHTNKIEGVPIENVFLGQPVDFNDSANGRIMQGRPVNNPNL